MEIYKPRKIEFRETVRINNWEIKVYSITTLSHFDSMAVLDSAVNHIPHWLENPKVPGLSTHNAAFLIVHEGNDGVWTLINWWTGENMLRSMTFFTKFGEPGSFRPALDTGFMACVWEMEVISFERAMWVEHILKKADEPDFSGYFNNVLSKEV
jgi:hypothetical protein